MARCNCTRPPRRPGRAARVMPGGTGTPPAPPLSGCPAATTTPGPCSARPTSSCTPCRSPLTCPSRPRPAAAPRTSTRRRSRAGTPGPPRGRDRPRLPPAPRLPGHAALAGDGVPDLGGLGALLPDRPADDRRRGGPRRGADQPQGAIAGRKRRPAPVARGRSTAPLAAGPHTGRVTARVLPIVAA